MYSPATCNRGMIYTAIAVLIVLGRFGPDSLAFAGDFPPDVKLQSSYPPDGYICPVQEKDKYGNPMGLGEFSLMFTAPVQLDPVMISVIVSGGETPTIAWVEPIDDNTKEWLVVLDGPITPGEWTEFILPNGRMIMYSALPGDVNQDGILSEEDRLGFQEAFQSLTTEVLWHDIDGNGYVDPADDQCLQQVHETSSSIQALDIAPEPSPGVVCCVHLGACSMYLGTECPEGITEVTCPCTEHVY